jgi:phosphoglycerate dehydrogenase-like enzyme
VYDPAPVSSEIETAGCQARSFHQLLAESDLITLHCPSTAQTRGMINRETVALMKPGAILINVARGDLIDSAALTSALQQGHVSAAALDVFAPEPIPPDHAILKMDQVIVSPHVASTSVQAMRKLRTTVAGIVASALRGERLPNVVNGVSQREP